MSNINRELIPVETKDIQKDYALVLNYTGYEVDKLPVLNLNKRQGSTDYIDFISSKEMSSPVMKFRDVFGRPGIALHLVGKKPGYKVDMRECKNTSELDGVLVLFQRYSSPGQWSLAWGESDNTIAHAYNKYHDNNGHIGQRIMACKNCVFNGSCSIKPIFLARILNGSDPVLKLAEKYE